MSDEAGQGFDWLVESIAQRQFLEQRRDLLTGWLKFVPNESVVRERGRLPQDCQNIFPAREYRENEGDYR